MMQVRILKKGGLEVVRLEHAGGSTADVAVHGAHVLSFVPAGGHELLFVSGRSAFEPGKAVRGGIPVIFPQFADAGPLPKHGFARTALWQFDGLNGAGTAAQFSLSDTPATRAVWNHRFQARLLVQPEPASLSVSLEVTSCDTVPFAFTAALHTYFRVEDIRQSALHGLTGTAYTERGHPGPVPDPARPLRFSAAIDRNYWSPPGRLAIQSPGRTISVQQVGFEDSVVWNPWQEGAAALADMDPDGWSRMLCVEAATIAHPVHLQPGQRWIGTQMIGAHPPEEL